MEEASRVERLAHSARWFLFAKTADDSRRARYWRVGRRLRRREMERRHRAADALPRPSIEMDVDRGFVVLGADALPGVEAVVEEVRRMRAELALGRRGDEKPYLLDQPVEHLAPSSSLLRLALDEDVIATAARYLGVVPVLTGVTLLASPYVAGPPTGSQLFHSDWEDVRQVKLFVNCSDVQPDNGPLTGVTSSASRRVKDAVHYRYGGPHFRLPDDEVLPRVTEADVTAFTGAPGSAVFIDTSSCLHFGSRLAPGGTERLVVQFQYLTPPAFDLVLRRRSARPFAIDPGGLTALQRLVLRPGSRSG